MFSTALILTAVGGLNWGLIALLDFNLVAALFGANTVFTNLIYLVVGVAALYVLIAQIVRISQRSGSSDTAQAGQYREQRPAYSNR